MSSAILDKPARAKPAFICKICGLSASGGNLWIWPLGRALRLRLARMLDAEDGAVVARLSVEGAELWAADESPEYGNFSPESLGGGSVRMVMTMADPDAAFERAVTAGATVVWPVSNQYGWRLGRIVDPFGHHWEIGRPLADDA